MHTTILECKGGFGSVKGVGGCTPPLSILRSGAVQPTFVRRIEYTGRKAVRPLPYIEHRNANRTHTPFLLFDPEQ